MLFSPIPKSRRPQLQISERRLLLMAGDALAVVAAVFIALRTWAVVAGYGFTLEFVLPQTFWFFLLAGLWLLLASANDFYTLRLVANRTASLQRLLLITMQMVVIYLMVFFVSPRDSLPRLFILYYGVWSFVLIGLWRLVNPALIGWASEPRRVLVVGSGRASHTIIEAIRDYAVDEYDIRGVIGEEAEVGGAVAGIAVVGTSRDLMNFVLRDRVRELILPSTHDLDGALFQGVMDAYVCGAAIVPMPLLYETLTARVPVEHVNDAWSVVLPIEPGSGFSPYPFLKRFLDVVLGLVGVVGFAALLPILALMIRLDSRGKVFYSQQRVGLNGRLFWVYKLRSMVSDAEADSGAVFSQPGDPRVTRVGRLLRKTRLDELPQLYNVVRGDMSLIGPRPERPEHVGRLTEQIPFYRTRHIIRPGLTGWAQVRFGYGTSDSDALVKLQYDLYYIRHQSLALDLTIIMRTIGKVMLLRGV